MSYEKTTWADGDVITAQKLNNIEGGIGKAEFEVFMTAQMNVYRGEKGCYGCQYPSDFDGTPDKCLGKFVKEEMGSGFPGNNYTQIIGVSFNFDTNIIDWIICANGDKFRYAPKSSGAHRNEFTYVIPDPSEGSLVTTTYYIEDGVKKVFEVSTNVQKSHAPGFLIGTPVIEIYENRTTNVMYRTYTHIVSVDTETDTTSNTTTIASFTTANGTVYTYDKTANKFVATFAS